MEKPAGSHVAFPVVAAATALKLRDARWDPAMLAGAAAAAVSTAGARRLVAWVDSGPSPAPFAAYRLGLAAVVRRLAEESPAMTEAYARAGVDTSEAGRALRGLVEVLNAIDTGKPSRSRLPSVTTPACSRSPQSRRRAVDRRGRLEGRRRRADPAGSTPWGSTASP